MQYTIKKRHICIVDCWSESIRIFVGLHSRSSESHSHIISYQISHMCNFSETFSRLLACSHSVTKPSYRYHIYPLKSFPLRVWLWIQKGSAMLCFLLRRTTQQPKLPMVNIELKVWKWIFNTKVFYSVHHRSWIWGQTWQSDNLVYAKKISPAFAVLMCVRKMLLAFLLNCFFPCSLEVCLSLDQKLYSTSLFQSTSSCTPTHDQRFAALPDSKGKTDRRRSKAQKINLVKISTMYLVHDSSTFISFCKWGWHVLRAIAI